MPSPQTALSLITSSARLIGVIATGETLTADEANDGLNCLNDLLETWSTESLTVYGGANESFNTVAGQPTYTIGPAGNFNTVRPVRISSAYCTYQGVDFPVEIIGQDQYNLVPLKTQQQQVIEQMLYVNDNPLGLITLFPVPAAIVALVLSTERVLTAVPLLTTSMVFPPGYLLAMKHALAILMAPDYGISVSQEIVGVGTIAKANIKRANKQKKISQFDCALVDSPVNWRTGE